MVLWRIRQAYGQRLIVLIISQDGDIYEIEIKIEIEIEKNL